jgi:peptidoglycan hydrolase-like protein with peptidoglycan-binding domain
MSSIVRQPIAAIAIAALLAGWAAGAGAQSPTPAAPAAPPVATPGQPAAPNYPPLPLGHDDIREVQNQLIALGFDPGSADGQAGPATQAAAQQYDQSRGGNGQVAIDSALLARLKADTAPRLSYEQVAAHSHASSPAQAQASASSGANQIGGIIQQLAPLIGAAINSSNNYGGGYGYGYGGYPGPGYYGPPPVYGGYPYGY